MLLLRSSKLMESGKEAKEMAVRSWGVRALWGYTASTCWPSVMWKFTDAMAVTIILWLRVGGKDKISRLIDLTRRVLPQRTIDGDLHVAGMYE